MASIAGFYLPAGCKKQDFPLPPGEVNKIKHVVVITWRITSFDIFTDHSQAPTAYRMQGP